MIKEFFKKSTTKGVGNMYNNDNLCKKMAFTLAEVLITLGIIGVVAAMTIPTLLNNYTKKQTVVKLQRAFAEVNQVYRMSQVENGTLSRAIMVDMEPMEVFNKYWRPYFKISQVCNSFVDCGYKSLKPFVRLNNTNTESLLYPGAQVLFKSATGVVYFMQTRGNPNPPHTGSFGLVFDINGPKEPNMYGKDVFAMTLNDHSSVLIFSGYNHSDSEVNANCKKNGNGTDCGEKIRRDGWKISKDYPW